MQRRESPTAFAARPSIDELHYVVGDADQLVALVLDLDLGHDPLPRGIQRADDVVDGDRVAEIDGFQETDSVVANGNHRPLEVLEDSCGCGGHVADDQRSMSDAMSQRRSAAVLLVDVV